MLEVSNVRVYDLEESIIAGRNAMRLEMPEYTEEEFEKSLKRALTNAKTPMGSGHQTFLSGIRVSFDLKYPGYISPELQRYHFMDIVQSNSKMHRLLMMDIDKCCNKYVSRAIIDQLEYDIKVWNCINLAGWEEGKTMPFTLRNGETLVATNKGKALYYAFIICVSDCPYGIELFMRCSTNYLQLNTIYNQRKNHKLVEDWGAFCEFIKGLPYAKEFITMEGISE